MSPPADEFTFEDLTEVYRREQRNKTISQVRKDFYPAMRECLERLKRESEREFAIDQFSTKAKLASNQLMKFQEKSAQVFEFRFGKLMDMALRAAQGAKPETTRLTVEEKQVYDKVYSLLRECRSVILEGNIPGVVEAEEPSVTPMAAPQIVVEAMREAEIISSPQDAGDHAAEGPTPEPEAPDEAPSEVCAPPVPETVQTPVADAPPAAESMSTPDHTVVRIIEDIPEFAGPGRTYRLQKEDLVTLPQAIAKALVSRKKAVCVQVRPR